MIRVLWVVALAIGFSGCGNPAEPVSDRELICMALNAGPQTFGDIKLPKGSQQLCDCIFDVMHEEMSSELNDKILSILRAGEVKYIFDTERYMGAKEMSELEDAMTIWQKDCKQYRTKIDLGQKN